MHLISRRSLGFCTVEDYSERAQTSRNESSVSRTAAQTAAFHPSNIPCTAFSLPPKREKV